MAEFKTNITAGGAKIIWISYTDAELKAAWQEEGQGHQKAVERGEYCHIIPCSEDEALRLSRKFVEQVFAIPTCCHYDGSTLSLYCGDAGKGSKNMLEGLKDWV